MKRPSVCLPFLRGNMIFNVEILFSVFLGSITITITTKRMVSFWLVNFKYLKVGGGWWKCIVCEDEEV